jgi:hypothetical protein
MKQAKLNHSMRMSLITSGLGLRQISQDRMEMGEVERITVTASPTALDTNYALVGTGHLLDTKVAQIVIDIADACDKIRD